jgi:sec-independent protein translocase protein TatB
MNFLGVGPFELLIVAVIALLVLGPKGMTDLGRKTGRLVRKITRSSVWQDIMNTSRDLNDLPGKIMRETDLEDEFKEIRKASAVIPRPEKENTNPEHDLTPK